MSIVYYLCRSEPKWSKGQYFLLPSPAARFLTIKIGFLLNFHLNDFVLLPVVNFHVKLKNIWSLIASKIVAKKMFGEKSNKQTKPSSLLFTLHWGVKCQIHLRGKSVAEDILYLVILSSFKWWNVLNLHKSALWYWLKFLWKGRPTLQSLPRYGTVYYNHLFK